MTKRIAISLPDELYRRIEKARKARKVPRSAFIQEAVGDYVTRTDEAELEKAYFDGYRRIPDTDEDFTAWEQAALEDLAKRGDQDEWLDRPNMASSGGPAATRNVPSSSPRAMTTSARAHRSRARR